MAIQRITIQLKGSPSDDEHLQLQDFIDQLSEIKRLLRDVEQYVTKGAKKKVTYKVIDLKHNSPATVVLQAESIDATSSVVANTVVDTLRQIQQGKDPGLPGALLESFKSLALPKSRVSELLIVTDNTPVEVTDKVVTEVDRMMGQDLVSLGSITGKLEYLNVHRGSRFRIYPPLGPAWIVCEFPREMLPTILAAIEKSTSGFAEVYGEIHYRGRDLEPYLIKVNHVETLDYDASSPTLFDIKGIAPEATNGLTSDEFVRRLRDGDWQA